jgi:transcriptional regulator with XRE-family HTH domain
MKRPSGHGSKSLFIGEMLAKHNHVQSGRKRIRPEAPLTLGQLIHNYRESSGTSMRALARELGVSSSMVAFMEGDKVFPGTALLETLAKILRRSTNDLQGLDPRISFRQLRRVVDRSPELHDALRFMLNEIREGRAVPEDFARRLKP